MADTPPPNRPIHDLELPTLASALNPEFVQARMAHYLHWSGRRKRSLALRSHTVAAYERGRRCIIEYVVDLTEPDGTTETVVLIGHLRALRFGTLYYLTRALWNAGFQADSGDLISVPEPIGLVGELRMSFQKKVEGRVAADALCAGYGDQINVTLRIDNSVTVVGSGKADAEALARRVAEAAHKLHLAGVAPERRHTRYDELRSLERCLAMVAAEEPALAPRLTLLVRRYEALVNRLPDAGWSAAQRDFHGDKVVVDDGRVFLVDFCRYCAADPGYDIGNFKGHLAAHALRALGDPTALRSLEEQLEAHYVRLAGDRVRTAVRVYAELAFARHIYLSMRAGGRRNQTLPLIGFAEKRADALLDDETS